MIIRQMFLIPVLATVSFTAFAQKWEVGGVGGGSFYTKADVVQGSNSAEAKFAPGYVVGFLLGQEMGRYFGGEIRYTFLHNDAELSGTGGSARFGAQAHAIHYDFLVHFSPPGQKMRPFISFGAGIKHFKGTGTETLTQSLSNIALLTKSSETLPLASVGFGVKFRIHPKVNLRAEIKDYIGPVPTKIITPGRNATLDGWLHNLVPMVGISYVF